MDTEIFLHLFVKNLKIGFEEALIETVKKIKGAYSMVVLTCKGELIGIKDPNGFRPLCLGRLGEGWVIASETAALDIIGASFVREVSPGEMVVIDGPFAEATDLLSGFFIIDVPTMDDAVAFAARVPAAERGVVEVRPIWDHG